VAGKKLDKGTRVILATAAVVVVLVVGIVAIAVARGGGQSAKDAPYQPFFAGTSDRISKAIRADGPECFPDPKKGDRSFCLDLAGDQFVAYHVVPPGGTTGCLVSWDRAAKRYVDCHRAPVDPATLARFPVLTRVIGGKTSVFVDLRTVTAPPGR
jgi:hypothetical protein